MMISAVCTTTTRFPPSRSTGKERDAESGNDYFGARYYSSSMGRWLSPDWSAKVEPVPYAKLDNPQSLNLYVYVLNNPLGSIDIDGHGGGEERPNWLQKELNSEMGRGHVTNSELAQKQGSLDKAKSVRGAVEKGYGIAKKLTGELKETKKWHDIMQKAFDNAFKHPSSGLQEEKLYYYSVYQYAQQQTIYHGTNAGLSMVEIENGMFEPPAGWFIKITNEILTSGIRAQAQVNAEAMRQKMNAAHEDFVQRLITVYGSQQ